MSGRLIGIGGHLGAGKDAVADHLVARHGFVKLGMSDPLNDAMLVLNPVIPWDSALNDDTRGTADQWFFASSGKRYADYVKHYGYTEAKKHPEVRRLLQVFGTEIGRDLVGENVWVDIAKQRARNLRWAGKDVVITGIRFPNEVAMIRREQGLSVWVTRPGHGGANHASERSVSPDDFDETLINDGTLEHLYDKARNLSSI